MPWLAASRTQTPNVSVPASAPVLFQAYVALVEYGCTSCQLLDPDGCIQNSYRGFGLLQPVAAPVMVTCVPEAAGETGAAEAVTAAHGPYVNWSEVDVGLVPDGAVTTTSTVPAAWAGLTAVMVVSLTMVKLVAAVAPNFTAVAPVKPEPLIVTAVAPPTGPLSGATPVMPQKAPTMNDHVYGTPLTVSATTYLTPFCRGCWGIRITAPRLLRLLLNDGLVESITQWARAVPLPVNEWTGPAVVATLPPTWMKTGKPVGEA